MTITRKQALAAFLILVAVAAAGAWLFTPRSRAVATVAITPAPASRILAVNGRIRPRQLHI